MMDDAEATPWEQPHEDIMAAVSEAVPATPSVLDAEQIPLGDTDAVSLPAAADATPSGSLPPPRHLNERLWYSSRPSVHLHIPIDASPPELHAGLREIAKNHIRKNAIKFCERYGHGWMAAGGQKDPRTGKGKRAEWWWNVQFVQDESCSPRQYSISDSSQCFAGPSSSSDGPVSTPYIITVRYWRQCEAFRALGHILGVVRSLTRSRRHASQKARSHPCLSDTAGTWLLDPDVAFTRLNVQETAQFNSLSTMIDCSRNGVLLVSSVKYLCRKLALMGYNQLQLYTEETYKLEGEPFFGYLRGGYTQDELKEMDDYAFSLGIEMIPCCQTLGHLGQMLQWPRFHAMRDTTEVLLAGLDDTYDMLYKMISTVSQPFRSKKIHLGQDETHGLGHGAYASLFGFKDPTRIFLDHLQRVNRICLDLGLEPMIWSDMLFCLNAKNNSLGGYYDSGQPDAPAVEGLPANIDLVYWDYYHMRTDSYSHRIEAHKQLNKGKAPRVAAGSWTWTRFWTALPFTFAACRASQNACKAAESGVKDVMLTIWGDEGNEVDLWSSLPAWLYYADHGYTTSQEVDIALLKAKFDGITGGYFDDFVIASRLDDPHPETQTLDDRVQFAPNTSKWMMWEEPSYGFVTPSVAAAGMDLESHYEDLETYLEMRLSTALAYDYGDEADKEESPSAPPRGLLDHPLNARLRFPYLISKALAMKARLRERLHLAYTSHDWPTLEDLGGSSDETQLSRLRRTVSELHHYHRRLWMSMYKPFGWETLDLRYGGLEARLSTLHLRVTSFLKHIQRGGKVDQPLWSQVSNIKGKNGNGHLSSRPRSVIGSGTATPMSVTESRPSSPSLRPSSSASTTTTQIPPEGGIFLSSQGPDFSSSTADSTRHDDVTSLPELQEELHVVYPSAVQLLDWWRVSRPTYV